MKMNLSNYPYLHGDDRVTYSYLITRAIYACNQKITPNYAVNGQYGIKNDEDILQFWDSNTTICFGRYFVYESPSGRKFEFWVGLYSKTCNDKKFAIWFKKAHVCKYISALAKQFTVLPRRKSGPEVWIIMDGFQDVYKDDSSCETLSDAIADFLDCVLGVIQ
jgi:hypothetical protein